MADEAFERLTERQRQAVGLLLEGHTRAEIARVMGVGRPRITRILQVPAVKAALAEARVESLAEAQQRMAMHAHKALDVLIKTMDSDDQRLAFEAARDVLTRTGLGASQVLEVRHGVSADELAARARSIYGVGDLPVLDADSTEVEVAK